MYSHNASATRRYSYAYILCAVSFNRLSVSPIRWNCANHRFLETKLNRIKYLEKYALVRIKFLFFFFFFLTIIELYFDKNKNSTHRAIGNKMREIKREEYYYSPLLSVMAVLAILLSIMAAPSPGWNAFTVGRRNIYATAPNMNLKQRIPLVRSNSQVEIHGLAIAL